MDAPRFSIEEDSDAYPPFSVIRTATGGTMKAGIAQYLLARQLCSDLERLPDMDATELCQRLVTLECHSQPRRDFHSQDVQQILREMYPRAPRIRL